MSLEDARLEPRELRDPRAMRALAHPLRLTLLELMVREGTLTSTRAARLTGESTASCSFHLRQLAKYGFVEEAGGGTGRQRPWRVAALDTHWAGHDPDDQRTAAAVELDANLLGRDVAAFDRFLATRREEPPEWQEAGLVSTSLLFLTAEELEELAGEVVALVRRRLDRTIDPEARPDDTRAVRFTSFAVPLPDQP